MEKLNINLCELFKVKEKQRFWLQWGNDEKGRKEYCVENNKLYCIVDNEKFYSDIKVNSLRDYSIFRSPQKIELDKNTKDFLKLVKYYQYISKVYEEGTIRVHFFSTGKRIRLAYDYSCLYDLFDINLKGLELEKVYSIEELLKEGE